MLSFFLESERHSLQRIYVPSSGIKAPIMSLASVVFPEPDSPAITNTSPCPKSKDTLSIAFLAGFDEDKMMENIPMNWKSFVYIPDLKQRRHK